MLLIELHKALLRCVQERVRNGELTERSLAKRIGVSQPHMHNVLKGSRELSVELADQILQHMHMSILDVVEARSLQEHLFATSSERVQYCHVPVLEGLVGPGQPWPTTLAVDEYFPVPTHKLDPFSHPVIAKLATDSRMYPTFGKGDAALLDQSRRARIEVDPRNYYVVKRGAGGLVRRARLSGKHLFLMTEDSLDTPSAWEKVELDNLAVEHVIRARAIFLAADQNWRL